MSDATHTGVSEDSRAAIYAKAEESRLAELKQDGVEISNDLPEDWEEDEPQEGGEQQAAPEVPPEEVTPETQPTPEQTMRLKVDGVEVERPVSWVQAQAQKLAAADKRLEEASKAKTLYESRLAEIESRKPPEEPKKPSLPADIADALKALTLKQLATTDEEEFAELEGQKVLVYQEAARREWMARDEANEVASQQRQAQTALEGLVKKVQEVHPDALEIGRQEVFRGWLKGQSWMVQQAWEVSPDPQDGIEILNRYKAATNPAPTLETKREVKRSMDTVRSASAKAVVPEAKEEDDSPQAYIKKLQEMRSPTRRTAL